MDVSYDRRERKERKTLASPAMYKVDPLKFEFRLRRLDKGVTGLLDCPAKKRIHPMSVGTFLYNIPVELAKGDETRCNGDELDIIVMQ